MKIIPKEDLIVRESISMFFGDGEIWFEQLDALSIYKDVILDKFLKDMETIKRPSSSAFIGINLNESLVDKEIADTIISNLSLADQFVRKVAFIGLDSKGVKQMKQSIVNNHKPIVFVFTFINDYEKAKEWLVNGLFS